MKKGTWRRRIALLFCLSLLAGNVLMGLVGWAVGRYVVKVSKVPLPLLLPAITVLVSLQLGRQGLDRFQTLSAVLGGGVMYMLAEYCTFKAANMAAFGVLRLPEWGMLPAGALLSGLGFGVAALLNRWRRTKE